VKVENTLTKMMHQSLMRSKMVLRIDWSLDIFIDRVLRDEIERKQVAARIKTRESLDKLLSLEHTVGFVGLDPNTVPSFISLSISGLESYASLFQTTPFEIYQSPFTYTFTSKISELIEKKVSSLPPVLPLNNCLNKEIAHRPRFRRTLDFYAKVTGAMAEVLKM
jgi:hypothetical protein